MSRTPRVFALVAVLALPVVAVLASLLLADPEPSRQPSLVRIGESATATTSAPATTSPSAPDRSQLPPPAPVDGDDDSDDPDHRDDDADDDTDDSSDDSDDNGDG